MHIDVNAFAFANIFIIAHAKTTLIFHTYKPSCWILLLQT